MADKFLEKIATKLELAWKIIVWGENDGYQQKLKKL